MEDRIKIIKDNLTGDLNSDINFLNNLIDKENEQIDDAKATIEAINIVLDELMKKDEKKVEVEQEKVETDSQIDEMINNLLANIDNENDDEALKNIEDIIPKIENITKSNDEVMYCSFKSVLEKLLFEKIFAGEKKVESTPYANDTIYIIYADLLKKKNKIPAALQALDRAIYWNFLSRDAREKKLDIYLERKEMVKYLDGVKSLQMISYTPRDLADCYNKYGAAFNSLDDNLSAYAMYRLSYSYYADEKVKNVIDTFENVSPDLKNMTAEQIIERANVNDVLIGVNSKIINASREITTELINAGLIDDAKALLQNDYALTQNEEIAKLYNQLVEFQNSQKNEVKEEDKKENDEKENSKKQNKSKNKKKKVVQKTE